MLLATGKRVVEMKDGWYEPGAAQLCSTGAP